MADRRRHHQSLRRGPRPSEAAHGWNRHHPLWPHALARIGACMFIGFTIGYGLLAGGHLEADNGPLSELPARFAHAIGYSAEEVRITGLERHRPEQVLAAIGVKLGGSLIGFDAARARRMMENIDWVESARIHRIYPNELDIVVRERRPFAIWQRDGAYYVIDKSGAAISTLEPGQVGNLLLVTGEGAQTQVASLVNHLEGHRLVTSKVKAASRVGGRRWNLYLTTGQRVLLPETDEEGAIALFEKLEQRYAILSRAWSEIDLRLKGRVVFVPEALPGADGQDPAGDGPALAARNRGDSR